MVASIAPILWSPDGRSIIFGTYPKDPLLRFGTRCAPTSTIPIFDCPSSWSDPVWGLSLFLFRPDWCHTRDRIEPVYDRCLRDHHVQVRSYAGAVECPEPANLEQRSSYDDQHETDKHETRTYTVAIVQKACQSDCIFLGIGIMVAVTVASRGPDAWHYRP